MKKIISTIIAISMYFCLIIPASASIKGEELKPISLMPDMGLLAEYTQAYINMFEPESNISISDPKLLNNVIDGAPYAVCFSVNGQGYAIVDVYNGQVYEYTLEPFNPYDGDDSDLFYTGLFGYYVKLEDNYAYTLDNSFTASTNELEATSSDFMQARLSIGSIDITEATDDYQQNALQAAPPVTVGLPRALATGWVNGLCGPTSAYCMLAYRSMLHNNVSGGAAGHIGKISTYTGSTVSLSSLTNGMNSYILDGPVKSPKVKSCQYSFSRVKTEINRGSPLTLGTNGGGLASGGHVQTIHKYSEQNTNIALYVNNSWGQNNIVISYVGTAPSYLKDHVFFQ